MSGLFENLAATDDSALIAQRKAAAVANKRVKDHFGVFFANARDAAELHARLALVSDELSGMVREVTAEYGGDATKIEASIVHAMMPGTGMGQPGAPMGAPTGTPMGAPPAGAPGGGSATCPQCGGQMVNGQCPTCQGGGAYGGAAGAQGGAYGLTHSIPQGPSTGPVQASHEAAGGFCDTCKTWKHKGDCKCEAENVDAAEAAEGGADDGGSTTSSFREARRPKLCPYHSEVVDVSLGAGDPQAGFNAMSSHAWGDQHCKGGFEGSCNFRPAMVSQKYWDDKRAEYDERRQQRELDRLDQQPELSIDTEPITHAEPLPDEPGKEGVSDIDGELANAPSAVGAGEMAVAASTKEAEALKTVDLPTGGESALGGPSPKIDKGNSGNEGGWSLEPIDTQMDGSPHPTVEQDPTDKADYTNKDFLDQTRAVTETESLPANSGDAGYDTERNIKQYPTKTFPKGDQAKPVTRESLSAVDPDKNPIRELMEEYSGFLMPNQVEAAVQDWDVG